MKPPDKSKPPVARDDSLLDPEAFWESDPTSDTGEVPIVLNGAKDTAPDNDVAVVVSAPTSAPGELYLPRQKAQDLPPPKNRPRTTPATAPDSLPARYPPGRFKLYATLGLIVAVCVAGWLIWRPLGGQRHPEEKSQRSPPETVAATDYTRYPAKPDGYPQPDPQQARLIGLKVGTLKLTSDPSGAVVFLDDQKSGATPTTIQNIEAGSSLNVRIEAQGFRPWTQTVVFDGKDLNREFHAGLLEEDACKGGTGWVYITTDSPGATVELDEKRLPGKTPMVIDSVCAGVEHRIRVQARGVRTWWHTFNLAPGQVLNLKGDLKK